MPCYDFGTGDLGDRMHDDQHDFDDFSREPDFSSRRRRDVDLRNAPSWAQAFAWLGVLFGLIGPDWCLWRWGALGNSTSRRH